MFRSFFICFSLTILQTCHCAFAQAAPLPVEKWVKTLGLKNDFDNAQYTKIRNDLDQEDSVAAFAVLRELEKSVSSNHYFNARFYCLKADQSYRLGPARQKSMMTPLCRAALAEAYATGDEYLICSVSWLYGEYMYVLQQPAELAVVYLLKASEINDRLQKKFSNSNRLWLRLGDLLYHIHEYERSIYFIQRALGNGNDTTTGSAYSRMTNFNTIGQAYKQLGKLDSALINYERSMQYADKVNDSVWKGINVVFIAEIFYLQKDYNKAKQLIEHEYIVNYAVEPNVSAYGLQLLARINLAQGNKKIALRQVNEAQQLLHNVNYAFYQKMDYLQHTYYTAADVYRALGNTDSFYRYFQLYSNLHDSLERVAALSSIRVAQMSIDNENNYRAVQQLAREKQAEETKRNFIIAFLIMFSAIVILILNRQRQKLKYKEQLAMEQKATAEANMATAEAERIAAQAQLKIFTQTFIEKTALIEKLEQQVNANEHGAARQQLLEEIKHQTILTEEDWMKFKLLFEKIHPGFFKKLREEANDITLAEQRMAALTRLQLTTGQMAALLGISPNSVNKTKQRLRQRFALPVNADLEDFITKF